MKITLVDIQQPQRLFSLLDACEGPVVCCGMDLRHNQNIKNLLCSLTVPGRGIPHLELSVAAKSDLSRFVHFMTQ